MKPLIVLAVTALLLVPTSAADAKGCIKGAIVGGVAGHYAGHGVVGGRRRLLLRPPERQPKGTATTGTAAESLQCAGEAVIFRGAPRRRSASRPNFWQLT